MRIVGIVLALVMSWFALPGEASAKVWRDVIYDHMPGVGEGNFTMDIYAPDNAKKAPVVIMVHGGAWVTGNKQFSIGPDQAHFFNEQGFIYIAINYRLAPDHAFPAPVQDTASAISFVHKEIRKYGGDPNAIFLLGHSSGAHTVALVSIDPKYLAAYGLGVDVIKGTVPLDGAAYNLVRTAGRRTSCRASTIPNSARTRRYGREPHRHCVCGTTCPCRPCCCSMSTGPSRRGVRRNSPIRWSHTAISRRPSKPNPVATRASTAALAQRATSTDR